MKYLFFSLLLAPATVRCQTNSYARAAIIQYLQEGAWDAVLSAAATAAPTDTFLLQSAGYAAYQGGDKEHSQEYFGQVLALDSTNRQALYYTAVILKSDEAYKAALPLLQKLCDLGPGVVAYRVLLADCFSATGAARDAVAQLRLANNLSPLSPAITSRLANAYIRLKQWDSAERVLTPALAAHPTDVALLSSGITLAYNQKDWTRSSALADSMLATHRLRYEPMLTAMYADIEGVNWRHAVQTGGVLMALGHETEEVLYSTAFAQQRLRHWAEADTLLRRCIRKVLRPNLEHYYIMLAEVAAAQDDVSRAAAYYDTAYYLFRNPLTLYQKSVLLNNAGRKKEAKAVFEKYLALPAAKQDTAIAHWMRQMNGR